MKFTMVNYTPVRLHILTYKLFMVDLDESGATTHGPFDLAKHLANVNKFIERMPDHFQIVYTCGGQ